MTPADAAAALALFAVDPLGLGLILRGPPGAVRDRLLAELAACGVALRRVPLHVDAARLAGGIDLAASLGAGRPIMRAGLLVEAVGGVLVLQMAERWGGERAGTVAAALDAGGLGLLALDEGADEAEALPGVLADRCALHLAPERLDAAPRLDADAIRAARARLDDVTIDDELVTALCAAAVALGAWSMRGSLLALRVARAAAALDGRATVDADDAALAARLVLAPRATRLPPNDAEEAAEAEAQAEAAAAMDATTGDVAAPEDIVLEAAKSALPEQLLAGMADGAVKRSRGAGRSGAVARLNRRGRPVGARAGVPRDGVRLDLIATLRAAAPWQRVRGRGEADRLQLRRDDLRVQRCKPRTPTTTIFAVDASGSLALSRLAEAKGAVELLLAECYVRRDQVAVLAFRGAAATLLLPPTRAPARARRSLAGLPGGGGTPLALGIDAALELAEAALRRGETPTIVLLTDGQANIGRSGAPGRAVAQAEAMDAARGVRARGHRCLLIDTSPRRQPLAEALAASMGARYVPLPRVDASLVAAAVRSGRA